MRGSPIVGSSSSFEHTVLYDDAHGRQKKFYSLQNNDEPIRMAGWLEKRGKKNLMWRRRYFILKVLCLLLLSLVSSCLVSSCLVFSSLLFSPLLSSSLVFSSSLFFLSSSSSSLLSSHSSFSFRAVFCINTRNMLASRPF